jgi:hypothetical protein
LLQGFYKVWFQLNDAPGRSVMYAHAGKMLGGNASFAHIGTFDERDGEYVAEVKTLRHHTVPGYRPMAGADEATLLLRGRSDGDLVRFDGTLAEFPGSVFQAVMTPINEEIPPATPSDETGGIVNGLYSVEVRMLDGLEYTLTGVMLLNDGRILGGDAFFFYIGSYTSANGRWKGEMLNQEHTSAKSDYPVLGGHEIGVGFSGTCNETSARLEATALAGKRSLLAIADLKLVRPA